MQKKEYIKEAEKLIQDVKDIFIETEDLELIDSIRKLGLTNHFEEDVKKSLDTIASTHKSNYILSFKRMISLLLHYVSGSLGSKDITFQKGLSWWKNLGLTEKLNFAGDRLVESFMCTVGLAFQPQYKCLRKRLTKVINFILIIDAVYDLYGSLEELKHFTNAVDRLNKRGNAPSSILCYMEEISVSEDMARKHIRGMIAKTWQQINKKCLTGQVPTTLSTFVNIAHVAHSL